MVRIFPHEITKADIEGLLHAVGNRLPSTRDGGQTALFDFGSDGLCISYITAELNSGAYDDVVRQRVQSAILQLPEMQKYVVNLHRLDGPNDGSDDHWLAGLDIRADEVELEYACDSYNSSWEAVFDLDDRIDRSTPKDA